MIYIFLADGFEEIEAFTFVDIMRRAELDIKTVSVTAKKTVIGAHSISVYADEHIEDINENFDALILPGGMPGTKNLLNCDRLKKLLITANNRGKLIGAICAAPMVLGSIDILNGREATCYPSFEKYLSGARFREERVVVSDNIITSRGAGTAHDFALKFVEIILGKEKAGSIKMSMLY